VYEERKKRQIKQLSEELERASNMSINLIVNRYLTLMGCVAWKMVGGNRIRLEISVIFGHVSMSEHFGIKI
jgi:hypothetical protein